MRTTTYTEEFIWEDRYRGFDDLESLLEFVRDSTKTARKRSSRSTQLYSEETAFPDDAKEWAAQAHGTPRKRWATQDPSLVRFVPSLRRIHPGYY